MIPVDLGDGIIREMEETLLEGPFYQITDNEHEHTVAWEYRLKGQLVHRSAHVTLKEGLPIEALLGRMN